MSRTESRLGFWGGSRLGSGVDHVWVRGGMISGSGTKAHPGPGPNRIGCRVTLHYKFMALMNLRSVAW